MTEEASNSIGMALLLLALAVIVVIAGGVFVLCKLADYLGRRMEAKPKDGQAPDENRDHSDKIS